MKMNVYAIYDEKAGLYNKPFYLLNDQVALRAALTLRSDRDSEIAKYPEDYSMHYLGTYEDTTAEFDLADRKCLIRFHEIQPELLSETADLHSVETASA